MIRGVGNLLAGKLRSTRYSVGQAKSGAETPRLLRSMRFQLLVLDLDTADTNGFQVLRVLKVVKTETFSLRRTSTPGCGDRTQVAGRSGVALVVRP